MILNQYLHVYSLFNWSSTNGKLILTNFSTQINIYQYLTVTYQYLGNAYIIKRYQPWSILNDGYRLVILRQAWKGNGMEIHNPSNIAESLSRNKKAAG